MTDWYVGQKVQCVRDNWYDSSLSSVGNFLMRLKGPRKNKLYTIASVCAGRNYGVGITLRSHYDARRFYIASHFRPLVESKNDISEFEAILDRVNRHEVVDA